MPAAPLLTVPDFRSNGTDPRQPVYPAGDPATRGRKLIETHFDLIQRQLLHLSRRGGLPEIEAEEFCSWALFKLVDADYRILGSWEGRSSFPTFLTVVLVNLLRDYRIHIWGKWRPSAEARRRGPASVLLERRRRGWAHRQRSRRAPPDRVWVLSCSRGCRAARGDSTSAPAATEGWRRGSASHSDRRRCGGPNRRARAGPHGGPA